MQQESKAKVFTPEEVDKILFNLHLEYNSSVLDNVITDLEHELYSHKFQMFFPKLADFLTVGKIPKNEVSLLKSRFQSYFPHLSDLLVAGHLAQ